MASDRTDLTRWKLDINEGRQTWRYVESGPVTQNIYEKYSLGLDIVSNTIIHSVFNTLIGDVSRAKRHLLCQNRRQSKMRLETLLISMQNYRYCIVHAGILPKLTYRRFCCKGRRRPLGRRLRWSIILDAWYEYNVALSVICNHVGIRSNALTAQGWLSRATLWVLVLISGRKRR